jgi:3-hydroxybutyryl-CoA dehydratase
MNVPTNLPPLRTLFFEDLSVGMTETLEKTVASSDVIGFAQLTGDRNPIHLSEHFAARTSFGKRIAHGLYTASLISAVLGTRLPGPGAIYISQTLNFRAPVKIGDTVVVTVTVAELMPEKSRARLSCVCVAGEGAECGEEQTAGAAPLSLLNPRPRAGVADCPARHQPVPDEQHQQCAQRRGDKAGALVGAIPADGLADEGGQERPGDPQNDRQDEAARLVRARRKQAGDDAGDKSHDENPDHVHLLIPPVTALQPSAR